MRNISPFSSRQGLTNRGDEGRFHTGSTCACFPGEEMQTRTSALEWVIGIITTISIGLVLVAVVIAPTPGSRSWQRIGRITCERLYRMTTTHADSLLVATTRPTNQSYMCIEL